jgi:long-chain acyl-CoA synthetase
MTTAIDAILRVLDTQPQTPRVEYRGRVFTGADLRARIAARAGDLQRAGLGQGQMALIIASDNLSAIEQLLACWTLGAAGAIVDFRAPPARIAEWHDRLSPALVTGVRPLPGHDLHLQARDPDLATAPAVPADVREDDPAIVVSSSGTTGVPAVHLVLQGRLITLLEALNADHRALREGAMLSATSVAFSASSYVWLRSLLLGRKLVVLDLVHRISELDAALQRADVAECLLPPGTIRQLAALPSDKAPRYPQLLRLACVGGPARPEDKLAAVTRLSPAYLMTYSCVGVGMVSRIVGAEIVERPASCGRPEPSVQVEIRDGDRLCGPGEVGELILSSPRMSGHRPGDLGWQDAEGYLYITGRVQGLLSRNGVNFSAERLIAAALACPDVAEAGVVALQDRDHGDAVHLAVQVAAPAVARITADLPGHLRAILAAAEMPDRVHVLTGLPLNPGGKVDSRALTDLIREACRDPTP